MALRALITIAAALALGGVARADRLELRSLSVASGFERAKVLDREDEDAHFGKVRTRSWTVDDGHGVNQQVVELQLGPRSPRSLTGYLAHWRASHGCVAKEVKDLPALALHGQAPPQLTFEGSCEGGDIYIMRVVVVGEVAYELHSYVMVGKGAAERVRPAMRDLLAHCELRAQ